MDWNSVFQHSILSTFPSSPPAASVAASVAAAVVSAGAAVVSAAAAAVVSAAGAAVVEEEEDPPQAASEDTIAIDVATLSIRFILCLIVHVLPYEKFVLFSIFQSAFRALMTDES